MPIYDYQCETCDQDFEELVSPTEAASFQPVCPACQSTQVSKRLSIPAKPQNTLSASGGSCATGQCGVNLSPCASGACQVA